mgnify:FL=1
MEMASIWMVQPCGGVFYTVKKSEMTQNPANQLWLYKKQLTDDEATELITKLKQMDKNAIYIIYEEDDRTSYAFLAESVFVSASAFTIYSQDNHSIGRCSLRLSTQNSQKILVLIITGMPTPYFQLFNKAGSSWMPILSYETFNGYSLFEMQNHANIYQLRIDGKCLNLQLYSPYISNMINKGNPTYYFYSNPITVDNDTSYYYRVTWAYSESSVLGTVTVDKITFANTSVESV